MSDDRVTVFDGEGRLLAGACNTAMRTAGTEFVAALCATVPVLDLRGLLRNGS